MRIDLSADIGESADPAGAERETTLLGSLTSVNIACGVHAGTPSLIRGLVRSARDAGIHVGAHPSLPDREGFGRRPLPVSADEVEDAVLYQVAAVAALARAEGVELTHVKPHGALYHMAFEDEAIATAIVRAVRAVDVRLALVAMAGSRLLDAARRAGLAARREAFADRAYDAAGRLVPRGQPGAIITDAGAAAGRAVRLAGAHRILAVDGRTDLHVDAETLCIHGDTPGAPSLARAVREALEHAGILVAAP